MPLPLMNNIRKEKAKTKEKRKEKGGKKKVTNKI
jgi:hypothetical protein